ncbi:outer membrane beta-barrel protein [Chryseobacterium fistulae]|uniref:Outer membrane protein beta-barrel domain-containing protein n=1 Tax=Chryseobacterium fistulae TaxID=2675058 RepID=A0A6N4XR76_9FLAO|nr:outer membrane beta-barrel protein [Chryseobacterium fistulae]CAA7385910.1 hypothetical protein CHRY9393_00199 [Chryseobacterium fistulae]
MKKLFLGITVISYSLISAQQSESNIKFGAKAGVNLSTTILDSDKVGDSKTGIYIGGFVNIPLGRFLSIQPEVFYSQTGFKNALKAGTYSATFNGIPIEVTNIKANIDYEPV